MASAILGKANATGGHPWRRQRDNRLTSSSVARPAGAVNPTKASLILQRDLIEASIDLAMVRLKRIGAEDLEHDHKGYALEVEMLRAHVLEQSRKAARISRQLREVE